MKNLEYKIGGLDIEASEKFLLGHKFIVEAKDNVCSIYVASISSHNNVVYLWKLNKSKIVGGGNLHMDNKLKIILDKYSMSFGAIPNYAAEKFAELILPELKKKGIDAEGFEVNTDEEILNKYWKK